ncbi:hypothetical protein AADG42_00560 [Ammonicoccus fulvus]|uniref:Immunity protein 35 domain-containing protein n=1 Tax=Ammonicoccus fulvus TaxID=3138240 RepID=A0ABZ3FIM5_9ACTN
MDSLTPLQSLHRLVARMGVLATNSAALLAFSDSGTARLIPDGIAYDDAGNGDVFIVRRPDGPDGERWVLFGGDWDLFGRIDLDEDADEFFRAGERGPGVPDWVGFSANGDLNHLRGETLGLFTWFDAGRWHQSGAILDRLAEPQDERHKQYWLAELDQLEPWHTPRMAYITTHVDADAAILRAQKPEGLFEKQGDVAAGVDLDAISRVLWNAAVADEVATDPARLTAHFRAVAARVRTQEPTDEQLAKAVETAMGVRRLLGGPLPLPLQPGPIEMVSESVSEEDAAALAQVHAVVRLWTEAAAAETAAEIPDSERRFYLYPFGLFARTSAGEIRLFGERPDRLVLVRAEPEPAERRRRAVPVTAIAPHLWPGDAKIDVPEWLPYAALVEGSGDRASHVLWTVRGRWRTREVGRVPEKVWPDEWQVVDGKAAPDGVLAATAALRPKTGLFGRRRAGADEADGVRRAVESFLSGQGVLAEGSPARYPQEIAVEPVARQYARAMTTIELHHRLTRQGAAAAIGMVLGVDIPAPGLPPRGMDPLALEELPVDDVDEATLAARLAEALGCSESEVRMRLRTQLNALRYAKPHNPGGRPPREALKAMGHYLGVPIDNDRLVAACRLAAEYGCWPRPVPADWDPLA